MGLSSCSDAVVGREGLDPLTNSADGRFPDADSSHNHTKLADRLLQWPRPGLGDGSAKLPRAAMMRDPNTNLPHLGLSFRRIIGAADPIYVPRVSCSLTGAWDDSGAQVEQMGTPSANGDGTETVVFRLRTPVAPGEHRFMNLLEDFE